MVEKLRQLKEKSHMTNQQIAEKSNVPESTVARIFSGKTPNPTITTVISMVRAMGGSVADFLGEEDCSADCPRMKNDEADTVCTTEASDFDTESENELPHDIHPTESIPVGEKYYWDMIEFYKNMLKKKDEWIARLFWCLTGIMLFILFILIFDILHPNFGFVKY